MLIRADRDGYPIEEDVEDCECVICHRQRTLSEVRRVVEEVMGGERNVLVSGDYILSRLEKLS